MPPCSGAGLGGGRDPEEPKAQVWHVFTDAASVPRFQMVLEHLITTTARSAAFVPWSNRSDVASAAKLSHRFGVRTGMQPSLESSGWFLPTIRKSPSDLPLLSARSDMIQLNNTEPYTGCSWFLRSSPCASVGDYANGTGLIPNGTQPTPTPPPLPLPPAGGVACLGTLRIRAQRTHIHCRAQSLGHARRTTAMEHPVDMRKVLRGGKGRRPLEAGAHQAAPMKRLVYGGLWIGGKRNALPNPIRPGNRATGLGRSVVWTRREQHGTGHWGNMNRRWCGVRPCEGEGDGDEGGGGIKRHVKARSGTAVR